MVHAQAYVLDAHGEELGAISVSGPTNVVLDLVESFLRRYKELPASAEWQTAYSLEYEGVILKQSSLTPLSEIGRVVI